MKKFYLVYLFLLCISPSIYGEEGYAFKEFYEILKSNFKLGREWLLLKEPSSTLSWHKDPEPRLHIPIVTNPGCIAIIDKEAQHLKADGKAWITDNTKYHTALNGGHVARVHFIATVLD